MYGTVQRHEGTIEIESALGKGTTFIIRLPVLRGEHNHNGSDQIDGTPQQSCLRVLIVDDEPMVRDVVAAMLTNEGHSIETAEHGIEALEKFQEQPFDLVITDRAMPFMNGDQLAAAIKKTSPRTPIIMLTGFGGMMTAAGEMPEDVDFVASKPIKLATIREAIAKVTEI